MEVLIGIRPTSSLMVSLSNHEALRARSGGKALLVQ